MVLDCRLYLITPPRLDDPKAFERQLEAALDAGDVAALQLRLKGHDEAEVVEIARRLVPLVQSRGVAAIMNDSPPLAARTGCDGVHVGQDDMAMAQARQLLGRDAMIGVTCHDSRHLAMDAAEAGADYVAFGAFFPTSTKDAATRAEPEILSVWQETMQTPCVAIGGVTAENCRPLVAAGADFLAVSAGVWRHPEGPAFAVRAFLEQIEAGLSERQ